MSGEWGVESSQSESVGEGISERNGTEEKSEAISENVATEGISPYQQRL